MKLETQFLENHHARLVVEVEPQALENARQQAAREIAKQMKFPGFRPGKAPYHIVQRSVGQERIDEYAIEMLADKTYPKALEESGLEPYGPGKLEKPDPEKPLTLCFELPLEPSIDLGDYRSVRVPYETPIIDSGKVEDAILNIREKHAIVEAVDRPAEVGDEVSLLLAAQRLNIAEGEDSTLIRERSLPVTIEAEERSTEWPFPGFANNLIGLAKGDQKTVAYTFSDDSDYVTLRGKEAEYSFTVEEVKARTLPELTDEFVKKVSEYETVDALRSALQESNARSTRQEYEDGYLNLINDELVKLAKVQFAPETLEHELDHAIENLTEQLSRQNRELETYLKQRQITLAQLRDEMRPRTEESLRRNLILRQVAKQENIVVKAEEIAQASQEQFMYYARFMEEKEMVKLAKDKQFANQLTMNATAQLFVQRLNERLIAIAKGEADALPVEDESKSDEAPAEQATQAAPSTETADQPAGEA